jgi:carnitine O-palmitoyltransferase 2
VLLACEQVLTEAGEPVPAAAIEAQLRAIIAESPTRVTASAPYTGPNGAVSSFTTFKHDGPPLSWAQGGQLAAAYAQEAPVGALTALHRDEWADARAALEGSSAHNKAALHAIDSALFVLTLEHESPQTHEDLSRAMLHGDGRNRWFDKCFNVVVCGNGKAGIAWEHAWGDGVAVLYFFNEVYKALNEAPARSQAAPVALGPQHRISFDLTSTGGGKAAAAAARRAEAFTDKLVGETDLRVYQSPSMTKADVKKSGLAPDGVMQM